MRWYPMSPAIYVAALSVMGVVIGLFLAAPVAAQQAPPGATSCTGCHGSGEDAPYPIHQLSAEQIETAMAEFRSGARDGTVMPRIAPGFTEEETAAIAAWLAGRE